MFSHVVEKLHTLQWGKWWDCARPFYVMPRWRSSTRPMWMMWMVGSPMGLQKTRLSKLQDAGLVNKQFANLKMAIEIVDDYPFLSHGDFSSSLCKRLPEGMSYNMYFFYKYLWRWYMEVHNYHISALHDYISHSWLLTHPTLWEIPIGLTALCCVDGCMPVHPQCGGRAWKLGGDVSFRWIASMTNGLRTGSHGP